MPSAYRFNKRVTREWMEAVRRDYSHPSIVSARRRSLHGGHPAGGEGPELRAVEVKLG
jgi:hypothetical protein